VTISKTVVSGRYFDEVVVMMSAANHLATGH